MKIRVYKKTEYGPELLGTQVIPKTIDQNSKGILRTIDLNLKEFLKNEVFHKTITDTGFYRMQSCGDFWSSYRTVDGVPKDIITHGMRETVIGGSQVTTEGICWTEKPVATEDGETDTYIGIDLYDEGFVINSSARVTNILGGSLPAYFVKITSKNFKQGAKSGAKVFKDEKALRDYLKKHIDVFSFMKEHHGYEFNFEPASRFYEEDRKKPMEGQIFDEIKDLLAKINQNEMAEPSFEIKEDPYDEAYTRMKEMKILPKICEEFIRSQKVYMSEFGGALYDLNEEAQEAVRRTAEYGIPYHVVRTNSYEMGDMYSVLFVSRHPEEWEMEHRNPRDGCIFANVYNASMGIDEMGSILVDPANGGLKRVC